MQSTAFVTFAAFAYLVAMIFYILHFFQRSAITGRVATGASVIGVVLQVVAFFLRWEEFSRLAGLSLVRSIPLTNLYESILFFILCIMVAYLLAERALRSRAAGAFITALVGSGILFMDVSGARPEIQPLVPALQSNWLLAHVSLSFIAYSAFAVSFATGLLYLMQTEKSRKSGGYLAWTMTVGVFLGLGVALVIDAVSGSAAGVQPGDSFFLKGTLRNSSGAVQAVSFLGFGALLFAVWHYGICLGQVVEKFKLDPERLDEITYKSIAIGFLIFTLGGLIFGAIWADQAWGRYWNWDPKETWALVTWLIYAFYLHARLLRGWSGRRVNAIAVFGFICTVFTYFGVNLLLTGLHTYGSLK